MSLQNTNKQPDFISLGEALKDSTFTKWLEGAKARAKERAESGSSRTMNSRGSESATKYDCEKCRDQPKWERRPLIDPETQEQAFEWRSRTGPGNMQIEQTKVLLTEDVEIICECIEWKESRARLKRSGIDEEFQRVTFDDYKTEGKHYLFTTARRIAEEYVGVAEKDYIDRTRNKKRRKDNGVMFCGEPGSGKTSLIFAIGNELLKRKVPVLYFQHREEFNRIKDSGFRDPAEVYERLKNFRGVVLWDDIFKTKKRDKNGNREVPDWEADATWDIINHRNQFDLPTAYSTEWSPAELISLDRSFAGRLIERIKHEQDPQKDRLVWFRLTKKEIEAGMDALKVFDHRFMRIMADE